MHLLYSFYILILYSLNSLLTDETYRIIELGKSLSNRFKDPANQGPEILEDVQAYIGELYDLYERVSTRDGELIKSGVKEYDALTNSGIIPHFKMDVEFSKLKEQYYWSYDDRVLHAKDMFNETEILWNKVTDRVNYIRF